MGDKADIKKARDRRANGISKQFGLKKIIFGGRYEY